MFLEAMSNKRVKAALKPVKQPQAPRPPDLGRELAVL
jgi:hypothetical protein